MRGAKILRRISAAGLTLAAAQGTAFASFLDTDFWCRTYGCAVAYDTQTYDIYDNYIFATGSCCVPFGGKMDSYYPNFQNLRVTGTTDLAPDGLADGQGFALGITQDGSTISQSTTSSDGYLDASDSLSAFSLSSATDIRLDDDGQRYSHSFWISSRNTRFSLRALASIANAGGDFANTISLGDIKLTTDVTTDGNDSGFEFGSRANNSNITIINAVDDLGDMTGVAQRLIHFGRSGGIRQRNGDIGDQTVRIDFLYEMPDYDMSMGIGELNIDVLFEFYREQSVNP